MIATGALLPAAPENHRANRDRRQHQPAFNVSVMALNPEPADPVERAEHDLPEKSYADAAHEDPEQNGNHTINEDHAIKETPPSAATYA